MKKRILRTVSVLLAVLLIFPQIMFSTSALTFNGTASASGDGSSTSASTGGYAVPSFLTQNSNRAVGYRFTVVDGAGSAKKSSQDVFRYNSYTTYGPFFAGYYKFNSKLPKTYYKNNYASGSYTTSSTTAAVCHDSNMGLTLPEDTTGIKAWCTSANIGKVLSTLWSITVSTLESNAWAVLIEPIFPVKIQNTYHSLTVTEMAVYGAAKFGAGSNGGASSNSNSWGFVSEYTNRYLPNSLRLTSALAGLPAAANATSRLTFSTIITSGYGAAFVYGDYLSQDPEIVRWTYYQPDYKGFYVYVQTNKATRLRVPTWTSKDGQDDIIWYEATAETNNIRGQSYNWKVYVPKSSHKNEIGYYATHFYAYTAAGKSKSAGGGYQPPSVTEYTIRQKGNEGFYVYANAESTNRITIPVWTEANGQDDILNYTATAESNEIDGKTYAWCAFVPFSEHNDELGLYNIHFYPGNQYSEVIYSAKTTFDPNEQVLLGVEAVRVYDDYHNFCFGTSFGPNFEDFETEYGYPQCYYSTSFSVYFPAGENNNYVRHSIWLEGDEENAVVRNEHSKDSEMVDVDLTAKDISPDLESYTVCAKVDILDDEGNVWQEGEVYKFYIPIQPTVIGNSVTAESITGEVCASAGHNGSTGKLYVGQRVYPKYEYISYNTFLSQHHLYSQLHETVDNVEENASIKYENRFYDFVSEYTNISNLAPVVGQGVLCPYTVMGDDGGRLKFDLYSYWVKDVNAYTDILMFFLPIVKSDVELAEIKLVDCDGYVIDHNNLMPGQEVTVRYYYKNNTDCTVYVNGYNDDESMIDGIFAIPAGETISVEGETLTVTDEDFWIWGGVYLEGAGIFNTEYEKDGDNNELFLECKVSVPLRISAIIPNSAYTENTAVITSYWVYNDSTLAITPDNNISVSIKVYSGNNTKVLFTAQKDNIVIPANNQNLVYFMWNVPTGIYPNTARIEASIQSGGNIIDTVTEGYKVIKATDYSTPDTAYTDTAPKGFTVSKVPSLQNQYATWWEWEYVSNKFVKRSYGIGVNVSTKEKLERIDPNAADNSNIIKSGYAFSYLGTDNYSSVQGYTFPSTSLYTDFQCEAMLYPEFGYKFSANNCSTLMKKENKWQFKHNATYGQKHFIPIYFPDTEYIALVRKSDMWTPAGMLTVTLQTEPVTVKGNAYEDWYIQH